MNKRITGLLALLLAWTMIFGAAGCSAVHAPSETEAQTGEQVTEPVTQTRCTELGTPLADVRVRQALAHAIDVDTIIEALFYGNAEKAVSFTIPDVDVQAYEYDPQKAKELLAEAEWPSDYVLDVVYYHDDQQTADLLAVIGSYWEAVGVRADFRKLEGDLTAQLWKTPENGNSAVEWDLAYGAVAGLTESEFYDRFESTATNNSHTPEIEGLDQLLEQAMVTQNYGPVQRILAEQTSFLPLFHQNGFVYTSDHLDAGAAAFGNDQFAFEKDILNWTTDREDRTLYTDGGPEAFFSDPTVNPGLYLYQELLFDRLIAADKNLNPGEGQLAESYAVLEDGKTLEFLLRENLIWHDGEPLTVEDVKFTFELYMKCPGANAVLTEVLSALEGAEAYTDGTAEECTGIAVEENKITFRFETLPVDALKVFSQWPVLPGHCLETVEPENLQQHDYWKSPVGSGPYKVSEVELGKYCILERWEDYRKTGEGNIAYVRMNASGETNVDIAVLAARDLLDYAWGKATDDAAYIAQLEGMNVTEVKIPYTRCFYINQYPHEAHHDRYVEPTE